jgi:hypothetical protein
VGEGHLGGREDMGDREPSARIEVKSRCPANGS